MFLPFGTFCPVVVDFAAGSILFAIDLLTFSRGQIAALSTAIGGNLPIDIVLLIFNVAGLTGPHLASCDTLRNALLLFGAPLIYFTRAVGVCGLTQMSNLVVAMAVDGVHGGNWRATMVIRRKLSAVKAGSLLMA